MIEFDSSRLYRKRASVRYLMAAVSVAAALAFTWGLKQLFPATPNALYFCAIVLSARFGGFGPGILASIFTGLAIHFTPPPSSPVEIETPRIILFMLVGIFTSWLIERQRRIQAALQQAREELEAKVGERTAALQKANEQLKTEIAEHKFAAKALGRSEQELHEREELYQLLTDNANDFIRMHDLNGRSIYASPSVERLYGRKPTYLFEFAHPDDIESGRQWWTRVLAGDGGRFVWRVRNQEGDWRWLETQASLVQHDGRPQVMTVCRDVTERMKAEEALQETQVMLARVARVTTVGELTASISHEVNQPLAAVVTNANASLRWLAAVPPNLAEAREAISRIVRDGNRAGDVITRIRTLLKKGEPIRTPLNINEVIQETITLAQPELARHKVTLQTELATELPRIPADRVQLQQVLLNLVVNALDSMRVVENRPRVLRIRTDAKNGIHRPTGRRSGA
jgi:PAS domain S-box-containing protein